MDFSEHEPANRHLEWISASMNPQTVTWNGSNFTDVEQLLRNLAGAYGEPLCRRDQDGGLEVWTGMPGKPSSGGWKAVRARQVISVNDGDIIGIA
jgi:hypothetical protein